MNTNRQWLQERCFQLSVLKAVFALRPWPSIFPVELPRQKLLLSTYVPISALQYDYVLHAATKRNKWGLNKTEIHRDVPHLLSVQVLSGGGKMKAQWERKKEKNNNKQTPSAGAPAAGTSLLMSSRVIE